MMKIKVAPIFMVHNVYAYRYSTEKAQKSISKEIKPTQKNTYTLSQQSLIKVKQNH